MELHHFSFSTFIAQGGAFMYPILVVALLALAIIGERLYSLLKAKRDSRLLWDQILPLVNKGDFDAAQRLAEESDTPIARIFSTGIARARTATTRSEVELAMEESLMEVTPLLERRTHYLATLANVATLLGLLGTIIGLIEGFSAVSGVNAAQKSDQLSAAVAVAMNCTAFGLMTAIPALLVHSWLQSQTNDLVDGLEMASVKFLNALNIR